MVVSDIYRMTSSGLETDKTLSHLSCPCLMPSVDSADLMARTSDAVSQYGSLLG
jgi:hypothetical protein